MNEEVLKRKINDVINTCLPIGMFKKIHYEDKKRGLNFLFVIDEFLGIELAIDFMDKAVTLFVLKLDNGAPYKDGYYRNETAGPIRLYFQFVALYFELPFDKKKSVQLTRLEVDEDKIAKRVKENIQFYTPIFHNEKNVLSELHKSETWEQIYHLSKSTRIA